MSKPYSSVYNIRRTNLMGNISYKTFKEEYLELLQRFDVLYNPIYVFDAEEAVEA